MFRCGRRLSILEINASFTTWRNAVPCGVNKGEPCVSLRQRSRCEGISISSCCTPNLCHTCVESSNRRTPRESCSAAPYVCECHVWVMLCLYCFFSESSGSFSFLSFGVHNLDERWFTSLCQPATMDVLSDAVMPRRIGCQSFQSGGWLVDGVFSLWSSLSYILYIIYVLSITIIRSSCNCCKRWFRVIRGFG